MNILEFFSVGWPWWAAFSIFAAVTNATLMIFLRCHYSIDIIAGVFFGHFFWILAERYSFVIDWYILRIPLEKRVGTIK